MGEEVPMDAKDIACAVSWIISAWARFKGSPVGPRFYDERQQRGLKFWRHLVGGKAPETQGTCWSRQTGQSDDHPPFADDHHHVEKVHGAGRVMMMIVYDADDGDEHLKHRELTKGKFAGSFHLRECRTKEGQAVFLL